MSPSVVDVLSVAVLVAALWATTKLWRWWQMARIINNIPGPATLPILGNILEVLVPPEKRLGVVASMCCPTRPLSRIWLTSALPYVILYKAQSVEVILSSSKLITKSKDYDFLLPWLGRGLLVASGPRWQSRRKLLTPTFHFRILEDFTEVFLQKAEVLVGCLGGKMRAGEEFDIMIDITLCTLDIILETAMGQKIDVQKGGSSPYVEAVLKVTSMVQDRQMSPWLHPDILYRIFGRGREQDACIRTLHNMSLAAIRVGREKQRKREEEQQQEAEEDTGVPVTPRRLPFLELLLRSTAAGGGAGEGQALTDEEVREEVDTFMFEGHDTTATAITMTLHQLGLHQDIQDRVYAEIEEVVGGPDAPLLGAHLRDLRYLEMCIKESLRLFPSVPLIGRTATSDVTIANHMVPAGTRVMVFPYLLHRDPDQFPDPERYDPDRFLPEVSCTRHPYAYVPFSAGPRNCIGQKFAILEEKAVLASVLRHYVITSSNPHPTMKGEIVLRPHEGAMVHITPRIQRGKGQARI